MASISSIVKERLSGLFKSKRALDVLTGEEQQEFLREASDMGADRLREYRRCSDYYDGEHYVRLLERARRYLEASGLRYTENFCETIADALAERLSVTGFNVEENEDASDWLTKVVWPKNNMGETAGIVHTQTTIKGDGFIIVTFDADTQLPKLQWNRPEIMKPVYADDDPTELLYVSKIWTTSAVSPTNPQGETINRLNIYFPDKVEKWFSVGQRTSQEKEFWAPHLDEEDLDEDGNAVWPTPWTVTGELEDEPIGLNVVHFRNKPKGRTYGVSELRGVIPQQDALTKQLMDLFYVMDTQGWKQRWVAGVPDDTDLNMAIGEWVKATNPDAKFGEFEAEDPGPMNETIESTLRRMAARSKTPLHQMMAGGELPSGETLKTAESPLVHKAEDREITHGVSWANVAALSIRTMDVFGTLSFDFDPESEIKVLWGDVESRNEQAETNTLGVQVELLGLSKTTALRKLGYDPDEETQNREAEEEEAPDEDAEPVPPPVPVVTDPAIPAPAPVVTE